MDIKTISEMLKNCPHLAVRKAYYLGIDFDDYVCMYCGKRLMSTAEVPVPTTGNCHARSQGKGTTPMSLSLLELRHIIDRAFCP